MRGHFTQAYTWREIVALYRLTQPAVNLQPRYNIAPTTTVDVVIPSGCDRLELAQMRWDLIPSWCKKTPKDIRPHHALGMRPTVPETILGNHQITGTDQGG